MKKHALLVTVSNYLYVDDLDAATTDGKRFAQHILGVSDEPFSADIDYGLGCLGFTSHNTRMVSDARATRKNVIHRLERLAANIGEGDYALFYFAGHGYEGINRVNDELQGHRDQMLCLHGFNYDSEYITGADLERIFKDVPASATIEIFIDACYSFGVWRSLEAHPNVRLRGLHEKPADLMVREMTMPDVKLRKLVKKESIADAAVVAWAGALDTQVAAEVRINGVMQGLFTYRLLESWRINPYMPRAELYKTLKPLLKYKQHSQELGLDALDAERNQPLFGLTNPDHTHAQHVGA